MRTEPTKSKRRQLRVSADDDAVIAAAAASTGRSVSEFMVDASLTRAQMLMADRTHIELAPDAWDSFVAVLDSEPEPNARLAALAGRVRADVSS
jgi:uncharacterized protein (DUF1778 family)